MDIANLVQATAGREQGKYFFVLETDGEYLLLADGTDFAWKCNEHCLLLVGYDEENYWFNDPWHDHGVCPQPKQLVEDCHAAQGMFAVTLRPKGEA